MTGKDKTKDDYFEKKDPSAIRSIGGLLTFSTILPINVFTSIEEMAKMTWLWPLIGALVGMIGFIISYFLLNIVFIPSFLLAAIVYSFFLIFNGFHHVDGLIDIGDALMVHGSPEKKISVMRDSMIGTGGIATFFIVATITIASLNSLIAANSLLAILICEMSAKSALVTCATFSKSGPDGTGKFFIESMSKSKFLLSSILMIVIAYLLNSFSGVVGVLGGVLGGMLIALIGRKSFKIATGDVLGASNELGRMFSLLTMLIACIWV